ncbi:MAG: pentapeptide repeat-containing protein, partial [Chloroflexota bacterium]
RSEIYEDLLEAVYKRDWESGRNRNVGHLTLEDFVRILEEIGISTWHRDGRTTTIGIVHNRCKKSGLVHLLKTFQEGAEEGVGRLFAAFYFRQHGVQQDGTKTFEFTHKSFSEYLTAKRLVRALGRMYVEIQLRKDTYERGWDESDALSYWVEIYTNAPRISADLIPFIRNEIALCDTDKTALWQLMLCDLISWLLKHGMPTLAPRQDYIVENQIAVHAEEGLLALLNACARVTQQVSRINYFEENEFAASIWLDRLCGKNMANTSTIFLNCVSYMSFKNCDLSSQRMFEADLQSSDLSGANLLGCNLMLANLTDVNLSNANLGTNFYRAITTPRPRPFEDYDPDDQYFISEVKLGAFISIKSDLPWDKIIEVVEGTSLTNLHEISLMEEPYLIEIDFIGVNLIGTRLPDGTLWHMGRDMSEFTDPT